MKRRYETRITNHESRTRVGSALILAVVLTSLLAIVGVMFLMVARVDSMATSGISENRELDSAVETVIAKISQELVLDVPGTPGEEYYDYPDSANRWLASLEPYEFGGTYYWRQITDLYRNNFGMITYPPNYYDPDNYSIPAQWDSGQPAISNWYLVSPYNVVARIIADSENTGYTIIDGGDWNNNADLYPVGRRADADGDGVADSRWIKLPDMSSSKGKPIYAAIRIIDNGGMLNVNTAYKFDPYDPCAAHIDGSSQTQINLLALSERGSTSNPLGKLDNERFGYEPLPHILNDYIRDVVWRYNAPVGDYTPFDISDELELRYRFLVNQEDIDTRIEEVWDNVFQVGKRTPFDSDIPDWFDRAQFDVSEPNKYSYRHIGTTYNMDRIIDPNGEKMLNVNDPIVSVAFLYGAIRAGLEEAGVPGPNSFAAQMAVNIVDYRDDNNDVSTILVDGDTYYGFERPCVYISELVYKEDVNDPTYGSYAIELYKPYSEEDEDPINWHVMIDTDSDGIYDINETVDWSGTDRLHVIKWEDPCVPLGDFGDPNASAHVITIAGANTIFVTNSLIELWRPVDGDYIVVDSVWVPGGLLDYSDPNAAGMARSFQRDITRHKCIRRLWDDYGSNVNLPTLFEMNNYFGFDPNVIQAHPADADFTNIGEIGIVFCKPAYYRVGEDPVLSSVIGYGSDADTEDEVRTDVNAPIFQQIFNYLTVFDPTVDGIDNNGDGYGAGANVDPNELKIPGRININTAPWYVIAQLPWMQYYTLADPNIADAPYGRAQAICDYRDNILGGFRSTAELMSVPQMRSLRYDADDNLYSAVPDRGPDLTDDSARDDFEERDLIFARISNLVTVRSDAFTAYILVRIGADGPQKRVIAILDRSNVYSSDGKVRIVALHPVPDPR